MGDVTILPPLKTGKRPTIADSVLVDKHLRRIDALLSILGQIRSALSLQFQTASVVDDDTITALEETHAQLREQHNLLCALL